MGWTAPRTWVVAEMVTHTVLNVHLRDNLDHIRLTHSHRFDRVAMGSPKLGPVTHMSWGNQGTYPHLHAMARNGTSLYWNGGVGTFAINELRGTTTAALLKVGPIEASTGGTIAADGTHNHI